MIETLNSLAPIGIFRASEPDQAPRGPGDDYWYEPRYLSGAVGPMTALQLSAVYACHRILSGDIAKSPLLTYRRKNDNHERATDHYLYNVLRRQFNPYLSARRGKALMQNWALFSGNSYAAMDINTRGQVTALWPWHPDRTRVFDGNDGPMYEYTKLDGKKIERPWATMLHIRGLETDGWMGLNPIAAARTTLDLALEAERFTAAFYRNDARPGGILKVNAKDKAAVRAEWVKTFGGAGNGKVAVLDPDADYEPLSMTQADAEYIATRKMGIADICRIYGVPLHKVAELDRATFSNIEEQQLDYVSGTLSDWMANWEAEIMFSCLSEREQTGDGADGRGAVYVEFLTEALLRGRFTDQMEGYGIAVDKGIMERDEVRGKMNLNRRGGNAAKLMVQSQMIPLDDASGDLAAKSSQSRGGGNGEKQNASTDNLRRHR